MITATLCFLVRSDLPTRVLLGRKRIGFGAGKWGGFGGKVEAGETIAGAAARELAEEAGVRVREVDLQPVGVLTFLFPHRPPWSQEVHVFLATTWAGEPVETDEMTPAWFALDDIPYDQMWQDGPHWLPRALAGERLQARFTFQADNETVDKVDVAV
ncbi:MAG: NUDIX domain-containing protein [Chloroflexi bacterium]|nr:NUDIX domain-containing protein [Chloroflexota bacterium]MBU1747502.1 NUDIX domain-containing protein [Chloroflexota bacterium]